MSTWSLQRYKHIGRNQGFPDDVINTSAEVLDRIHKKNPSVAKILTLRHLSELSDISYLYLRSAVHNNQNLYKKAVLKKQSKPQRAKRTIYIPTSELADLQRWLHHNVLRQCDVHPRSFAYSQGSHPIFAASEHSACEWLIKLDITDFFHSISESSVYKVFRGIGYTKLLSFELARLTTIRSAYDYLPRWHDGECDYQSIPFYDDSVSGVLPQGAPTSPMLSNLVAYDLDERLEAIAHRIGFCYTRYADDIAFSTERKLAKSDILKIKNEMLGAIRRSGFMPNEFKTKIAGPGSRKIVLGLVVNNIRPTLTRQFKDDIRKHFYFLESSKHGIPEHAKHCRMSTSALYEFIEGKAIWAKKVEPAYGRHILQRLHNLPWPPIDYSAKRY